MQPDRSIASIIASNVFALLIALWQDWSLVLLLWPYWFQSVIIGWYARKRILALDGFSIGGTPLDKLPIPPRLGSPRYIAGFFTLHYGFFHLMYLIFLVVFTGVAIHDSLVPGVADADADFGKIGLLDLPLVLLVAGGFWLSHRRSHREHLAADLAHAPSASTLMLTPYLRVVPMHLTILLGIPLGGTGGALLFGTLKSIADVLMHKVEHRMLQGPSVKPVVAGQSE